MLIFLNFSRVRHSLQLKTVPSLDKDEIREHTCNDQNPSFLYDGYDALIPPSGESTAGQKLMVQPQDIKAFDKDAGLGSPVFYTFNGSGDEYKYFELNRNTGQIYMTARIPENQFNLPVTLVVKATQYDNKDRYAVTTLTLTRGGVYDSDLQFLQRDYTVRVLENAPLNSPVTTLLTNKPLDRRVHFIVKGLPTEEFTVSQQESKKKLMNIHCGSYDIL